MSVSEGFFGKIPIITSESVPEGFVGLYTPAQVMEVITPSGERKTYEIKPAQLVAAIFDPK